MLRSQPGDGLRTMLQAGNKTSERKLRGTGANLVAWHGSTKNLYRSRRQVRREAICWSAAVLGLALVCVLFRCPARTASSESHLYGRQCRRHRFFRRAAANSNRTGHRSRRENFHRSQRTVAPRRRPAAHGRAARGAARRRAQAIHLQRRGDRAGVRRRARRQLAAEHLRGGNFGLWTCRSWRPGPDGQPRHIQAGAPNATFMPGLWGPQAARGRSGRSTAQPAKLACSPM